jgi:heptaprenyl diphosphate synthase
LPETKQLLLDNHKTSPEQELQLMVTALLEHELLAVEEILLDFTLSKAGAMQELISSVVQNRGKRLRPLLVLLSGCKMDGDRDALRHTAAAVELIHTASLLHDDVIDGAQKRRGDPSLNALYGNSPAVLAGDYFFARAFELVALCKNYDLIRLFTAAISTMCEGEIEQSNNAFNCNTSEAQYLRCAYSKTAVLLEACCEAGALLAKLDPHAVQQLKHYGRNLGMAFQITDDLLDIWGNPACTGKPTGSDLQDGTITLPLIYLLEDRRWGARLRELVHSRDFSPENLAFLMDPACQNGPLARAQQQAATYIARATECLHTLEQTPGREILVKLAAYVLQRNR